MKAAAMRAARVLQMNLFIGHKATHAIVSAELIAGIIDRTIAAKRMHRPARAGGGRAAAPRKAGQMGLAEPKILTVESWKALVAPKGWQAERAGE